MQGCGSPNRRLSRRCLPLNRSHALLAHSRHRYRSLIFSAGLAFAEGATQSSTEVPQVPERLRYLFDVPWCRRWRLECISCEKKDDRIVCERRSERCGSFQLYHCEEYNVLEERCLAWFDGCNEWEPAFQNCSWGRMIGYHNHVFLHKRFTAALHGR